jgi:hypothetical protein
MIRHVIRELLREATLVLDDIIKFTKLKPEGEGDRDVSLFLTSVNGVPTVIERNTIGSMRINVPAKGKEAFDVYDLMVKRYQRVERLHIVSTDIDEPSYWKGRSGRELLKSIMKPGPFQIGVPKDEMGSHSYLMQSFQKMLGWEMKSWTGSFSKDRQGDKFSFLRHPFWNQFQAMVRAQLPSGVVLYRGIYGKIVNVVKNTGKLPVHQFSSWTTKPNIARDIIESWGPEGVLLAVVKAVIPAEMIMLAPISLPDYEPDPDVLIGGLGREDEYVVRSSQSIKVEIMEEGVVGSDE